MKDSLNPQPTGESDSSNLAPPSKDLGANNPVYIKFIAQPGRLAEGGSLHSFDGSDSGRLALSEPSLPRSSQPGRRNFRRAVLVAGIAVASIASVVAVGVNSRNSQPAKSSPSVPEATPTPVASDRVGDAPPVQLLDIEKQPDDVKEVLRLKGFMDHIRTMAQRYPDFSARLYRSQKTLTAEENRISGHVLPSIWQKSAPDSEAINPGETFVGRVVITRHGVDDGDWILPDNNVFYPASLLGRSLGRMGESGLAHLPPDGILNWPIHPAKANEDILAFLAKFKDKDKR